jgi:hypothetical protein
MCIFTPFASNLLMNLFFLLRRRQLGLAKNWNLSNLQNHNHSFGPSFVATRHFLLVSTDATFDLLDWSHNLCQMCIMVNWSNWTCEIHFIRTLYKLHNNVCNYIHIICHKLEWWFGCLGSWVLWLRRWRDESLSMSLISILT